MMIKSWRMKIDPLPSVRSGRSERARKYAKWRDVLRMGHPLVGNVRLYDRPLLFEWSEERRDHGNWGETEHSSKSGNCDI